MSYIQLTATISPKQPGTDILIAELADAGFESFEETGDGLKAWAQEELLDNEALQQIPMLSDNEFKVSYSLEKIEDKNWNEEWESNFSPIELNENAVIKASFHTTRPYAHEFLISPKMAFGTGHHETTWLMANALFTMDLGGKKVLDMGCGTGILAVIAEKLGATELVAIDIEEPAIENTYEHLDINQCSKTEVRLGGAEVLKEDESFDVILANINRNVLTRDMRHYVKVLKTGGLILFSGFFTTDVEIITAEATKNGLLSVSESSKNNWAQLTFSKG
ncbi:MAG: 50S ribosomal protein L11 methyltransferase [Bacteroidota bacterium]